MGRLWAAVGQAMAICALPMLAAADGVYKMYATDGSYLGEFEIVGDVGENTSQPLVMFDMPAQQMRFYLPPDGVYVTMTDDNPIIRDQVPFYGYWVSTAPRGQSGFAPCRYGPTADHEGVNRDVHGAAVITNTAIDGYNLIFSLDIGVCEGNVETWATSAEPGQGGTTAASNLQPLDVVRDICGNEDDAVVRALGCSVLIAHPEAGPEDVAWGHWARAYVRCLAVPGTPQEDVVADLVDWSRHDPANAQEYFQANDAYSGPIDGVFGVGLYNAAQAWADKNCPVG